MNSRRLSNVLSPPFDWDSESSSSSNLPRAPKPTSSTIPVPSNKSIALSQKHYKVIVIGAGASGLTAATQIYKSLSSEPSSSPSSPPPLPVLMLEARPRVGGRIHTETHSVPGEEGWTFEADSGAAWVHGDGVMLGNKDSSSSSSSDSDTLLHHISLGGGTLTPISPSNPWMDPRTNLVSTTPTWSLFVGGLRPSPASVERALKQYDLLMYACTSLGFAAYHEGEGLHLTEISMKSALELIRRDAPDALGLTKVKDLDFESRAVVRLLLHFIEVSRCRDQEERAS